VSTTPSALAKNFVTRMLTSNLLAVATFLCFCYHPDHDCDYVYYD